jgi:DMSO/TMAO reductase YedYZ molybdopterin-dependent catalytic subunit
LATTRRRFVEASTSAAVGLWLTPTARAASPRPAAAAGARVVATLPFVDEGTFPLETAVGSGLGKRRALDLGTLSPPDLVVPQERFFIRTGSPERVGPAAGWKVRVHGRVERPFEVGADELARRARPMGLHLLECAGNSRAAHFGFISAARWEGVPVADVLPPVRRQAAATQVLVSGFDEHATGDPGSVPGASWIFALEQLRAAGAFLATGMNGAPLAADHGYPVRLVVPGWYGCTAIKWVDELVLVDDDAPATDQMREYAARTHQDPSGPRLARDFQPATLDPAAVPVRVEKLAAPGGGISYRIVGIRWGGASAGARLAIRLGAGQPLVPVEGREGGDARPWSLWSHTFRPPAPGRYRIELALTDRSVRTRRLDRGYYAREVEIPGP